MVKNIANLASFSLIERGKVRLLLRNDYRDLLLQKGIVDVDHFLRSCQQAATSFEGRTIHPSIAVGEGQRGVVRQYTHGGFLGALNRKLYLFGSRSFRELALTEKIRASGIPTAQPLAAIEHSIFGPFYHAYLISLEIPGAQDLPEYLRGLGSSLTGERFKEKRRTIRSVGLLIREFHRAGFYHSDLQLKNILIRNGEPFLIDFDRSYHQLPLPPRARVKNLLRLNRSVEKWKRLGLPVTQGDRWRFFLSYAGDDEDLRKELRKALPGYQRRLSFHRLFWNLRGRR